MKILLVNPNTSVELTDIMAEVARAAASCTRRAASSKREMLMSAEATLRSSTRLNVDAPSSKSAKRASDALGR